MLAKSRHAALVSRLVMGLLLIFGRTDAAEPKEERSPQPAFTHIIAMEAPYYTTGPQQGRPADGKFPAGTKVKLLRKAGSYSQVQTANGVVAYVASDALKKLGADAVQITKNVQKVAQSTNEFAFALYKHLRSGDNNLFFSPASISTALAMSYAGAEGQTKQQMAQVLHFDLKESQLEEGFGMLAEILNSGEKGYQLNMANRLWGQKTYPFRPEFLTITKKVYGAELAQVNFAEGEKVRQEINAWVEKQTNGKIENLIPPGVLDAMTRLVLTNAIYFKGTWAEEFSKQATEEAPFHLSANKQTQVPMMRQTEKFPYTETDKLQVLELPYGGDDLSMIVLLPKQNDGLAEVENKLTAQNLQEWTKNLRKRQAHVFLPKFTLTSEFRLADVLRAMGMTLAFSGQADFSGISSAEGLTISEVVHKAYVDVNEEGTEAAAATGVVIMATAARPQEPVTFRADHPFAFLIRDNRTGTVLFLGRMVNPQK